jgi:hypothetical protein
VLLLGSHGLTTACNACQKPFALHCPHMYLLKHKPSTRQVHCSHSRLAQLLTASILAQGSMLHDVQDATLPATEQNSHCHDVSRRDMGAVESHSLVWYGKEAIGRRTMRARSNMPSAVMPAKVPFAIITLQRRLCSRIQRVCMLVSTECSSTRASPATNTCCPFNFSVDVGRKPPWDVRRKQVPAQRRADKVKAKGPLQYDFLQS